MKVRLAPFLAMLLASSSFGQMSVSPPDSIIVEANSNATVAVPILLSNPDSSSIDAFGLKLVFPMDLLQFDSCDTTGSLTKSWTAVGCQETTPGIVTLGGFHTAGINRSGVLLTASFLVSGKTGEGVIQLNDFKDDIKNATSVPGIVVVRDAVTGIKAKPTSAIEFKLLQNYPNPFNPQTHIRFEIPIAADGAILTRLSVFNISGQRVRVLLNAPLAGGEHEVFWDGKDDDGRTVPSGLYFYELAAGTFRSIQKMLLLR